MRDVDYANSILNQNTMKSTKKKMRKSAGFAAKLAAIPKENNRLQFEVETNLTPIRIQEADIIEDNEKNNTGYDGGNFRN